jgi:chemotaxis regulatin CheY-phosphate phosphatase CheZ
MGSEGWPVPYQRLARHVLEEWRSLERRLATVEASSPEAEALIAEARALRDEYQHLIDEAIAHHRPEPPAFPEQ